MKEVNIKGLTDKEVKERILNGQINKEVENVSKSKKEIILSNTLTYFNFIFLTIAILLIIVGSFRDLTFLPIIIINTLIGIYQELKAKKILDEITILNTPNVQVIRNNKKEKIKIHNLVKDDIVVFTSGNQIPADAKIIKGSVTVNESLLTGEEDEIKKSIDDNLLSGSFIINGECIAILTKVGEESYISKLTRETKSSKKKETSEIIRSLNKIVTIMGILIIPIAITLFYNAYKINNLTFKLSIQSTVAAILGMIPEGLFLLASITLLLSAVKLAKSKILLHDMKVIETLARVDTLCIDKTGTITDGRMKVTEVISLNKNIKNLNEIIGDFVYNQNSDNMTMKALKEYFTIREGKAPINVSGFSSTTKTSIVEFKKEKYTLGAPEYAFKDKYKNYEKQIEEYAKKGYRVLGFTKNEIPIALIILNNVIRNNAVNTFSFFEKEGVNIKVISGDNPVTVSAVANEANIKNADKFIDCSKLSDEEFKEAIPKYTIFGRISPEQKRTFIKVLQQNKHVVGMVGDGVNDILALKQADCSVAMSSGSDVAVETAQLVLLDNDFARMPLIVEEGRKVVNNLERSGSLFLIKNIFSLLTAILSICFSFTYPLTPSQVSLISMFTIGIPAFLLSRIPNKDLIKGKFSWNVIKKALPGGLTDTIVVGVMVLFGTIFKASTTDISVASTILLAIVGLFVLYNIMKPINNIKMCIFIICTGGLIISMLFLRNLFGISETMSIQGVLLCIIFTILINPILNYTTILIEKTSNLINKFKNEILSRRHV